MSRRPRLLIGLASSIGLVVAVYAALPLIITGFLEQRLTLHGFSQVSVHAGYPRWGEVGLGLEFSRRLGDWTYAVRAPGVVVRFQLAELLAGRLTSIQIPTAVIERTAAPRVAVDEATTIAWGAIVPGQWLARLPTEDLALDELRMNWQQPAGEGYALRATGHLKDQQLLLKGEVRLAATDAQAVEFSAQATAAGALALAIYAPAAEARPMVQATNRVSVTGEGLLTVEGSLQARLEAIAPWLGPWFGPEASAPGLKGSLQSRWQGSVPVLTAAPPNPLLAKPQVTSEHRLEFEVARVGELLTALSAHLEATASLQGKTVRWQLADQSRLTGRLNLTALGLAESGAQPLAITLPNGLSGALDLSEETLALRLERGGRLHVAPLQGGALSVPESRLELVDTATLRYQPASGQWQWEPVALALQASPLRWRDSMVANGGILFKIAELGGAGRRWRSAGEVRIAGLTAALGEHPLPPAELSATFLLEPMQATAQGSLATLDKGLVVQAQGRHEFATGNGHAQFALPPVVFAEAGRQLGQLLRPWPYPVDLIAGRLSASGHLVWHTVKRSKGLDTLRIEDDLSLHLEELAGHYQEIAFSGLSARLALADHSAWRTTETVQLRIASVDIGIPITNLIATADMAPQPQTGQTVVRVGSFSADLLGGKARSEPFEWDLSAASHPVTVELEGLMLSEILALERREGLHGEGLLDGRLPVEITAAGVALRAGKLHARPPGGHLRYRPSEDIQALARANPSIDSVLPVLSNLRYEALNVSADSTPAGDLTLRVELRGSNPGWQSGRPVHLNVTLQENLPMLLRSLQFADELSEKMGDRAQKHYRKNP